MALNFSGIGKPIAKIVNDNKMKGKILCVDNNFENNDNLILASDEFKLTNEATFQQIPNTLVPEAFCETIFGKRGSGKSVHIRSLVTEYHKLWPNNVIFLISQKPDDQNLDDLKFIKRIPLNDFYKPTDKNAEIVTLDDFLALTPLLLIFDDIDALEGVEKKVIYSMINTTLKLFRSKGISLIITLHNAG